MDRSTWKVEIIAGVTSFFTTAYILIVNPLILKDAGIPLGAGLIATVCSSVFGCLIMGWFAKSPIILVPGMGVNAFFSYTIVQSFGLSWKQGLAVVIFSGLLFFIASVTTLGTKLVNGVPDSLKHGITAGIGLLLTFIGLQKGMIIRPNEMTFVELGDFSHPVTLSTLVGLIVTLFLFVRGVKGGMLAGLFITSMLTMVMKGDLAPQGTDVMFKDYLQVFAAAEFSWWLIPFWVSVFSMTMIVVFENMGLLSGMLPDAKKFPRAYQVVAISTLLSGVLGTSPTVAAAESSAGIAEGGKTGIPALVAAGLFAASIFMLPVIGMIPENAVAPVLIIVGALMIKSVQEIPFCDFTEGFPAFLIIAGIPLTGSIADGLAFGFIAYPLIKIASGNRKQIPQMIYMIAGMFFIYFVASSMIVD